MKSLIAMAALAIAESAQQMTLAGSAQRMPMAKACPQGKGKARGGVGKSRPGAQMANIRAAKKACNVRRHRAANR